MKDYAEKATRQLIKSKKGLDPAGRATPRRRFAWVLFSQEGVGFSGAKTPISDRLVRSGIRAPTPSATETDGKEVVA